MKNKLLILIAIASFPSLYAQSIEEKIATKACDCLSKSSGITEEIFRDCLTSSMSDIILTDNDPKVRESFNTVDGIQSMILKAQDAVVKECPKFIPEAPEDKSAVFYANSKNKNAQNAYTIAKDFMRDKNYKMAIESLQLSLKEDPNFVIALDDIAVCYRQLGDFDNAIMYYKKSLDIFPEGDLALMNIGVVYSLKSDFKTSISYYEKLIKYQPNNAEGYFGAGKNYLLLNDDEKALDNIFIAHIIYSNEKSEYLKDSEQFLGTLYQKMKSENKEDIFKKIAAKNNVKLE